MSKYEMQDTEEVQYPCLNKKTKLIQQSEYIVLLLNVLTILVQPDDTSPSNPSTST